MLSVLFLLILQQNILSQCRGHWSWPVLDGSDYQINQTEKDHRHDRKNEEDD